MTDRIKDFLWSLRDNKRAQIGIMVGVISVLAIILLLVIIAGGGAEDDPSVDTETPDISINQDFDPNDKVQRVIDGKMVPRTQENYLPIAIMVENLATVRPQAGLQEANLVYEALTEGGITRFMAIYAGGQVLKEIGPVRSARHYFVDWAEEYRGVYAHAGGSPQALNKLFANEYLAEDLSQMGGDHNYYWRKSEVPSPHNLFTSTEMLAYALRDKELQDADGDYPSWRFAKGVQKSNRPTEEITITLPFSSASYEVKYTYDRATNAYLRFNGGVAHTDSLTDEQISVKNVLVQKVSTSLLEADSGRLDMVTIGEGEATLFNNGERIDGTWKKAAAGQRTKFLDSNGEEMTFVPGNTWIEVLPDDRSVEYN